MKDLIPKANAVNAARSTLIAGVFIGIAVSIGFSIVLDKARS